MTKNIQPILILPEGSSRSRGKDAQRNNIMAAKLVAETVRTTLGPKGMDKMLVDSLGDITVTNDGVTILEEMQIEHPAAKMLVEIAKTQENEVGDGTTTVVVLAGELLKNAELLLDKEIHPTVIARGYRLAADQAIKILEKISEEVKESDLKNVAITAMTGKGAESAKEKLAEICINAIKLVDNINDIKFEKKVGESVEDSELIKGIVLDKGRVNSGMPKKIENAKILLYDDALEIKSTETDAKINITSPDQLQAFIEQEENILKNMVDSIIKSGCNVLFCQKGIDDIPQYYLAKKGIYAVRRVSKDDMDKLARATGAKIVSNLKDISESDLGYAGVVEEIKVGDEEFTYVKECKNPKAVTILIRGGSDHVISEVERAVKDAIGDVYAALKNKKVVGGAGSCEIEVSKELRKFANTLKGREQLAVNAFADSLEIIPLSLAENAGLDPIDMLTDLKSKHEQEKGKWDGIDVFSGKIVNSFERGVIEPLKVKTQAIKSASEVAELILRIDDIIAASGSEKEAPSMPHGGMPQGMY